MGIIDGRLVIVTDIAVHQLDHMLQGCLIVSQQILLKHADIVEGVYLITLLDPANRLLFSSEFTQRNGLQRTCLMVVAVADEGAFEFVEGILPTFLLHTDAGCLIVAGIGPGLVPCRLPKQFVGLMPLMTESFDNAKIEERLAIVGVRVALLQYFDGRL